MAKRVQLRRGTTAQTNAFTGAVGELTYDTELARLRVHDGATVGGKVIVGTRIVTTPIDVNLENTTGVRIINTLGNTNLPLNVYGALNVYSNENFATGALRVYQTFQTDIFGDYFTRSWNGSVWSAWDRSVKFSEKNSEAFGVGQSYVNVTSSRVFNTTYTNSTAKMIFVICTTVYSSSGMACEVYINNAEVCAIQNDGDGSVNAWMTFPVPAGASYRVNGSRAMQTWWELR